MKKQIVRLLSVSIILSMFVTLSGYAQENANSIAPEASQACVIPKVNGEHVPFPVRAANTKFNLAQGETYLLNGTLVQMNNKPFLKIDFVSQPWLATERMLQFPYFPLDSVTAAQIAQYAGKMVQMAVVADKNVATNNEEEQASPLKLNAILPPVSL